MKTSEASRRSKGTGTLDAREAGTSDEGSDDTKGRGGHGAARPFCFCEAIVRIVERAKAYDAQIEAGGAS